ncbi:FtsK/SpoIIIE domain-containing protein [Bacillus cereus group sp. BfR-BA-01358]|uniref:FtsK/SpoIIIE domain-containing protein n=1 Tax=Bacillus cereus group sp. BfR-BA-01358 TaxID=2920320 RepID=UPI001F56244E|nr:FtsK/SpoIIIE domain-containing protein [Bacillus cereus group sp. BfR-BA-01358]
MVNRILDRFKVRTVVSLTEKYVLSNRKLRMVQIIFNIVTVILLFSMLNANVLSFSAFLLVAFGIFLMVVINKKFINYRNQFYETLYVRDKLLMLLHTNKLFSTAADSEGRKYISRSSVLSFLIEGNRIVVRAHITGDNFSKHLKELDIQLAGALGLELESKQDTTPRYTDYLFLKDKEDVEQLVFTSKTLDRAFFEGVPIDVIPLTHTQGFSLQKNTNMGLYGRTGAGKTVALQWFLYNAVAKGCGTDSDTLLSIVDGKGADLFSLGEILEQELESNVFVGQTPQSLAKLSREFVEAMNARFEIIKENTSLNADAYDLGMTPNFLFIDELASIRDSCGSSKQGKELWNEILQNLGLIARKGRQASCHLCISTQDPNAENIPVELRNQITSVLYLGNPSNDRLKMAFSMCELENVPTISGRKGEALFYADGNNMIEPDITIVPYVDVKTKQDFIDVIRKIKPIPTNCN